MWVLAASWLKTAMRGQKILVDGDDLNTGYLRYEPYGVVSRIFSSPLALCSRPLTYQDLLRRFFLTAHD
eukprot:COSAG05_NODE_1307_length_5228_cov_23.380386_4_plen_69_part_00